MLADLTMLDAYLACLFGFLGPYSVSTMKRRSSLRERCLIDIRGVSQFRVRCHLGHRPFLPDLELIECLEMKKICSVHLGPEQVNMMVSCESDRNNDTMKECNLQHLKISAPRQISIVVLHVQSLRAVTSQRCPKKMLPNSIFPTQSKIKFRDKVFKMSGKEKTLCS
jgi:hypothetical protein